MPLNWLCKRFQRLRPHVSRYGCSASKIVAAFSCICLKSRAKLSSVQSNMDIQRNQDFKVERLAKDEAIQEVLGLANMSGCMYSFHLLCFLSLLQLPCFRWKTSQLRPDLLLPEKGMRRITGQSGIELVNLCKRFQRLRPHVSRYGCSASKIVAAFSCICLKSRAKLSSVQSNMEIQRNQDFKVERLAKDEAIQEVLGLANTSGCIYSFHLLCFLSLLQLPCFRWKTSQLRPDLLLPEKGMRRITGQSGIELVNLCKRFQRLRPHVSRYGCSASKIVAAFSCICLKSRAKLSSVQSNMDIQRNQDFKVERLAKDEAIQEVLGLANMSGCIYSFHLFCFLSLLQLPCFRWKTSQLRPDLLLPEKGMRRITGQSGIELVNLCKRFQRLRPHVSRYGCLASKIVAAFSCICLKSRAKLSSVQSNMEIQRNQDFKVERLAKDEAIQEVLGLANTSGCIYSFHLLCFLSLLQLPCFRWKTSQLRPDLLLPEKGMRRITGQSGIELVNLCKRFQRLRPHVSYRCLLLC